MKKAFIFGDKTLDEAVKRVNSLRKIAVIGAGTMGQGISMAFANASIPVKILEAGQEALDAGLEKIERAYNSSVEKGRISIEERDHVISTITGTLEYADLADADLVVEAVFEELDLKKAIFSKFSTHRM